MRDRTIDHVTHQRLAAGNLGRCCPFPTWPVSFGAEIGWVTSAQPEIETMTTGGKVALGKTYNEGCVDEIFCERFAENRTVKRFTPDDGRHSGREPKREP